MTLTITDRGDVPDAALPLAELAALLRLPNAWESEDGRAGRLRHLLRAALRDIEARTGRVLLRQEVRLQGHAAGGTDIGVPVRPAEQVVSLRVDGQAVAPIRYRLRADGQNVVLVMDRALRAGAGVELVVLAGHAAWADVPATLAEAVLLTAEAFDVGPREVSHESGLIGALLAPFRTRRLGRAI